MKRIPLPENTAQYWDGLSNFEELLYCRRCALFTADDQSFDLDAAVGRSFDLKFMFESRFKHVFSGLQDSIKANPVAWHSFNEQRQFPNAIEARNNLRSGLQRLGKAGFGSGKLISSMSSDQGNMRINLREFGNPTRARQLGRLAKLDLPGLILFGGVFTESSASLRIAGIFYIPGSQMNIGSQGWYKSRTKDALAAVNF